MILSLPIYSVLYNTVLLQSISYHYPLISSLMPHVTVPVVSCEPILLQAILILQRRVCVVSRRTKHP